MPDSGPTLRVSRLNSASPSTEKPRGSLTPSVGPTSNRWLLVKPPSPLVIEVEVSEKGTPPRAPKIMGLAANVFKASGNKSKSMRKIGRASCREREKIWEENV